MNVPTALKQVWKCHSLKSRLGFDLALYKTNSLDQIIPLTVSQTTGFQNLMINAGEIRE